MDTNYEAVRSLTRRALARAHAAVDEGSGQRRARAHRLADAALLNALRLVRRSSLRLDQASELLELVKALREVRAVLRRRSDAAA